MIKMLWQDVDNEKFNDIKKKEKKNPAELQLMRLIWWRQPMICRQM